MFAAFNAPFSVEVPGMGRVVRHLRLYTSTGDRPHLLIIADPLRRGTDPGETARRVRDRVCEWFAIDRECVLYVECDPGEPEPRRAHPAAAERWRLVEFLDAPGDPPGRCAVRRHPLRRTHVERLAGGALDPARR